MHSRLRPSPAMVIALIALFVSLGGTAAALSGSNTVQSDDLGPGAQVTAPDVAANAVNGSDVVDNSLTSPDIQNFSLGNGDFLTGSVNSRVVTNNSLTGADIHESTLVGVKDGDGCGASGAAFFVNARLCAGSDGGNRNVQAALNFCAGLPGGTRLPTWGEAVLLAVNHDVPGVAGAEFFWTSDVADLPTSGGFLIMVVNEAGNSGNRFYNDDTVKTVCVTTPD